MAKWFEHQELFYIVPEPMSPSMLLTYSEQFSISAYGGAQQHHIVRVANIVDV